MVTTLVPDPAKADGQSPSSPSSNIITGTWPLPNGSSSGTVSGLALASVPKFVSLSVKPPADGLFLSANPTSDPTTDGWDYALSGETDSADYVLSYMAVL
jgi:hypothetical protein